MVLHRRRRGARCRTNSADQPVELLQAKVRSQELLRLVDDPFLYKLFIACFDRYGSYGTTGFFLMGENGGYGLTPLGIPFVTWYPPRFRYIADAFVILVFRTQPSPVLRLGRKTVRFFDRDRLAMQRAARHFSRWPSAARGAHSSNDCAKLRIPPAPGSRDSNAAGLDCTDCATARCCAARRRARRTVVLNSEKIVSIVSGVRWARVLIPLLDRKELTRSHRKILQNADAFRSSSSAC